jgi:hypothetical protein
MKYFSLHSMNFWLLLLFSKGFISQTMLLLLLFLLLLLWCCYCGYCYCCRCCCCSYSCTYFCCYFQKVISLIKFVVVVVVVVVVIVVIVYVHVYVVVIVVVIVFFVVVVVVVVIFVVVFKRLYLSNNVGVFFHYLVHLAGFNKSGREVVVVVSLKNILCEFLEKVIPILFYSICKRKKKCLKRNLFLILNYIRRNF